MLCPGFGGLPENLARIQQLATAGVPQIESAARQAPPGHLTVPDTFKPGDMVWAKQGFRTDSEEPCEVLFGQGGTVVMVDEDGDLYIKFDALSKKQWVYKDKYPILSKVPPANSAGIGELGRKAGEKPKPKAPFGPGDGVMVIEDFITDSEEPVELYAGQTGYVIELDPEGDAYIQFECVTAKQWVYSMNFGNLAKAELEEDWRPVEEEEEVEDSPREAEQAPAPPTTLWKFEPPEPKVFALRAGPDLNAGRQGGLLQPGETFRVVQELRGADGILYLELADGRGWTFEGRASVGTLCRRLEDWEEAEFQDAAEATAAPEPARPAAPPVSFDLDKAKELLARIQVAVSDSEFQRWVERARRQARTRPDGQRENALRSQLGHFFTKACSGMMREFGFSPDRKGFDSMFKALYIQREDREVYKLAMDIERRLHVPPGTWFYIEPLRPDTTVYLHGLDSAPHLNGQAGVLGDFDHDNQRWQVFLEEEGEVKLVLAENLTVRPPGEDDSDDEEDSDSSGGGRPRPATRLEDVEVPWWVSAGQAAAARAAEKLKERALNTKSIEWTPMPDVLALPQADEEVVDLNAKPTNLFNLLEEIDRQEEEEATREAWADLAKSSRVDGEESEEEDTGRRISSFESLVPKLGGIDPKRFREVVTWGGLKDATVLRTTDSCEDGEEAILTVEERGLLTPEHMTPLKQLQAWREKQNRPHPKSIGAMPKRTLLGVGADKRQGDMAGMAVGAEGSGGSGASSSGAYGLPSAGAVMQPLVPPMRPPPAPPPLRRPAEAAGKAKAPPPSGPTRGGPLRSGGSG